MFSLAVLSVRNRSCPVLREPTAGVENIKSGMLCRLPRAVNGLYATRLTPALFVNNSAQCCNFPKMIVGSRVFGRLAKRALLIYFALRLCFDTVFMLLGRSNGAYRVFAIC